MRKSIRFSIRVTAVAVILLLAGCGDSHPIPVASGASSSSSSTPPAVPAESAFAAIDAKNLDRSAEVTENCNLDTIDGAPAGSKPLSRDKAALFAGWAANGDDSAVPGVVEIVLHGAKDFAVRSATGMPRQDVASANHAPALAASGYQVKTDLSAVVPGDYRVVLLYRTAGRSLRCNVAAKLTVR